MGCTFGTGGIEIDLVLTRDGVCSSECVGDSTRLDVLLSSGDFDLVPDDFSSKVPDAEAVAMDFELEDDAVSLETVG